MQLSKVMLDIVHNDDSKYSTSKKCFIFCSINMQTHKRAKKHMFYNIGLGGQDGTDAHGWTVKRFFTILKEHNNTNVQ